MRKKIVTLMLGFAVALSVAACGGNTESGKKDDNGASAEAGAGESAETSEPEEEAGKSAGGSESGEESEGLSEDGESGDEEAQDLAESGSEVSEDMWGVIEKLSLLNPTDALIGTEWSLSGGMVDGVELEQDGLEESLEMYGGKLNIVFDDDETISMEQGNGTLKGTYGVTPEDERLMGIVFDNNGSELIYAGLLADVEGEEVLMLFSDDTGRNAVYFTQNSNE